MKTKNVVLTALVLSMFPLGAFVAHTWKSFNPDLNDIYDIRASKLTEKEKDEAIFELVDKRCFEVAKSKFPKGAVIMRDEGFLQYDTGDVPYVATQARVFQENSGGLLRYICQYKSPQEIIFQSKYDDFSESK